MEGFGSGKKATVTGGVGFLDQHLIKRPIEFSN